MPHPPPSRADELHVLIAVRARASLCVLCRPIALILCPSRFVMTVFFLDSPPIFFLDYALVSCAPKSRSPSQFQLAPLFYPPFWNASSSFPEGWFFFSLPPAVVEPNRTENFLCPPKFFFRFRNDDFSLQSRALRYVVVTTVSSPGPDTPPRLFFPEYRPPHSVSSLLPSNFPVPFFLSAYGLFLLLKCTPAFFEVFLLEVNHPPQRARRSFCLSALRASLLFGALSSGVFFVLLFPVVHNPIT